MRDVDRSIPAEVADGPGAPGAEPAPRWARRFALAFLALFVISSVAGVEAWPLTGWRLFSHLRTDHQRAWEAVFVDGAGRESPVPFADLPFAYRGYHHVLRGFPSLRRGEQWAVCEAWADALRRRGSEVSAVRVYRIEWDLSQRTGRRAAPPVRTRRFECSDGSVREVGGDRATG